MLKVLSIVALFTIPFFSTSAVATEQMAQSFCDYVASNDRNNLRKSLSESKLRLRNVYDGIACDGLPMIRFAIKNNSAEVAEFIIKQLPSNQIAKMGDAEWAASNGFADSPIISAIKARSES